MHAYSFDSTRYETQQRLESRAREASNERLAHEIRGATATARDRKRARTRWTSWLHRPAFMRASALGARAS
jgi:hypothetical protein